MVRERIGLAAANSSSRFPVRASESIGATRTVTLAEIDRSNVLQFNPTAASVNVDLPAEENSAGAFLMIVNRAAATNALAVRNDAAGAVATIAATKAALLICDGSTWRVLAGA